jgi:pyrimidine deaminase RibD-like protein
VTAFSVFDHAMMRRALVLAEKGLFTATPNPRVGCVLTQGERVVGEGWHEKAGAPHAETQALVQASAGARGATAYVSMEPCNHHGRTPPCADAMIKARVARVVAAMRDPNPAAAKGGDSLAAAGIRFEHGLLEEEARELNIGFVSRMTRGRPWVRLKIAATLEATAPQRPSQWITPRRGGRAPLARARLRHRHGRGHGEGRRPAADGARRRDAAAAAARGDRQPRRDAAERARAAGREGAGVRGGARKIPAERRNRGSARCRRQSGPGRRCWQSLQRRGVNELHVEGGSG